jgi:predicted butyrate kinase (DUF1464 family)
MTVYFIFTANVVIYHDCCRRETHKNACVISGLRREVDAKRGLLGYYAASSGNFLPIRFPETSVRNNNYSMRNNPAERSYYKNSCRKT